MTETFIEKAKAVHGDKYDYSKVEYINSLKEVIIICREHGEFEQLPKTHKRGNGCIKCGKDRSSHARKNTLEEFIQKATQVHGDKYDYSKVEYKKSCQKVIIHCKEHGEYLQTPNGHIGGAGCVKCATQKNANDKRFTRIEFIEKAIEVHRDKYDYSKVEYKNFNTKVCIICSEHGEYFQTPAGHLTGRKCIKCGNNSRALLKTKSTEQIIREFKIIHGDKYDYSKVQYKNGQENIIIICKEHGEFEQSPRGHLSGKICCPICLQLIYGKWNSSNTNEFIQKAKEIHGDKYDYSEVEYVKAIDYVKIGCKQHGYFEISPNSHLNGSGCNTCGMIQRTMALSLTTQQFIQKAKDVHGDKYDYSKVEYMNYHNKINISCNIHGLFIQTSGGHLSGRGCIKCSNKYSYSSEEWILKAKEIHGDKYDYSKSEYMKAHEPISIICKEHGEFKQNPNVHLRPSGCPRCSLYKKYSKLQIKWLNFLQVYYKINIEHAENDGEFSIPDTKFKADGYCKETNTIYEFHGDIWHGNPNKFKPDKVSFFGKTYGELYQKTLVKEERIKELGYHLVVMWEGDWNRINHSISILQRKIRK
jgi:hypothetical protein